MKRWWLVLVLMLSVGVNVGLLVSRLAVPTPAPRLGSGPPIGPPDADLPPEGLPPGGGPGHGDEPTLDDHRLQPVQRLADVLGLEGKDRDAFVAIQRRFLVETLRGREHVRELQLALRRELISARPDRAEADRLLDELTRAHQELERAFVDNLFASRELLDEEQERLFLRAMARLHDHAGPHGEGGGPPFLRGRRRFGGRQL